MSQSQPPPLRASLVRRDGAPVPWPSPVLRVPAALLCIALIVGLAFTATLFAPAPARAAEEGRMVSIGGWQLGAFRSSTGEFVYCVEPGAVEPSGPQHGATVVDELPGYSGGTFDPTGWRGDVTSGPASGEVMRQMNYVLWVHGRTEDPDAAAAVQLAIWLLRADPGVSVWLDHHLGWVRTHGGQWHLARAEQLAEEARVLARPAPAPDPGALELRASGVFGEGWLVYPAGTSEVTIEGARFEDGSRRLAIPGGAGGSVGYRTDLHPDGWQRRHVVRAAGSWSGQSEGWPARLVVHPPVLPGQQLLSSGVAPVNETQRGAFPPVEALHDAQFSPLLSTQVPERFLLAGSGVFRDTVTFRASDASAPWPSRTASGGAREPLPIVAEGVVYGPFAAPQPEASGIPAAAPVAGRARVVADRGPGSYEVRSPARPDESGYYYWVWSVREAEQSEAVRSSELLPAGYRFQDHFGLEPEGHVVPSALRWTTQLTERELGLDALALRDRVTVTLHRGAWLRDSSGTRIPARLRLTVYRSAVEPQRRPVPPADAMQVAEARLTVQAPDAAVETAEIALPPDTRGWITVRTCLRAEDQPEAVRGYLEEWCDDYGIPSETARIVPPEVRTQAQAEAPVGGTIHDVAIVSGRVPAESTVEFLVYLEPRAGDPKFDETWRERRDERGETLRWTPEELSGLGDEERCLAQPVARTPPVAVSSPGEHRSPEVTARSVGTVHWVEVLTMPGTDASGPIELHRGRCGLENERTVIGVPQPRLADTGDLEQVRLSIGVLTGSGLLLGCGLLSAAWWERRRERGRATRYRAHSGAGTA